MELLVWLWAYDKRLLCGMRHSYQSFVYIWIVPIIICVSALIFAYMSQMTDSRDLSKCFIDSEAADEGRALTKLVLI